MASLQREELLWKRNGGQYWELWLSSICRFVEVHSGCQMNSEHILLVDAFSLGWHVRHIYPWDLYFEPNTIRWVQYCSEPSPFPLIVSSVRFGIKSHVHFNGRKTEVCYPKFSEATVKSLIIIKENYWSRIISACRRSCLGIRKPHGMCFLS